MKTRSIHFPVRLPAAPTDALPGSEGKVRILAERARLGVSLWHPLDAKLPADAETAVDGGAPADLCLAS